MSVDPPRNTQVQVELTISAYGYPYLSFLMNSYE